MEASPSKHQLALDNDWSTEMVKKGGGVHRAGKIDGDRQFVELVRRTANRISELIELLDAPIIVNQRIEFCYAEGVHHAPHLRFVSPFFFFFFAVPLPICIANSEVLIRLIGVVFCPCILRDRNWFHFSFFLFFSNSAWIYTPHFSRERSSLLVDLKWISNFERMFDKFA